MFADATYFVFVAVWRTLCCHCSLSALPVFADATYFVFVVVWRTSCCHGDLANFADLAVLAGFADLAVLAFLAKWRLC